MHQSKWPRKFIIITAIVVISIVFTLLWSFPRINNDGTIKIYDRNEVLLFEYSGDIGHKEFVALEDIPEDLINSTIATEDNRFYKHNGIDIKGITRAAYVNLQNKEISEGGSTITQQYVRMADERLETSNRKSYVRKVREMLMAMWIDTFKSKDDIIEGYLNETYYGNLAYGIQSASRIYFNKDVSNLSLAESATLVGIAANPTKYDPYRNPEEAINRRNIVLDRAYEHGHIDTTQLEQATSEPLALSQIDTQADTIIKAPHFVEYINKKLQEIAEKENFKTTQGLRIHTTLDSDLNRYSEVTTKRIINELEEKHNVTNAAVIIIDNNTNELLTMVGGIDYFNPDGGKINMTTALRQPGSAIKPVTYAQSFNQGETAGSIIYDVPTEYPTKSGEGFIPNNYDGKYNGIVTAREALASSLNLPAVEMLNRIGIQSFLDTSRKMGITTFKRESEYDLAITLGGAEVNLFELTNVFATFAREGEFNQIQDIYSIENDKGEILYEFEVSDETALAFGKNSKQISYLISDILSDNSARSLGFGQRSVLNLPHQAAVKTGTTTDWHDNWTIGYTPDYTIGVWVGNNNNAPMTNLTGVTGAAPIWNNIFQEILNGQPENKFTEPEDLVHVEICKLTGALPDQDCKERYTEKYILGTEPTETKAISEVLGEMPNEFDENFELNQPPLPIYKNLEIISPKQNAIFETTSGLNSDEAISFEVLTSNDIARVEWLVDEQTVSTQNKNPFNYFWKPEIGTHTIKAIGYDKNGNIIDEKTKQVEVLDYKSDITN